jgi:hypothetical protein
MLLFQVHVSPDGRDLVAISEQGYMYYIDNFERLSFRQHDEASSSPSRKEIVYWYTLRPYDGHPAINLAFQNDRIAVTGVRSCSGLHELYGLTD